MVVRVVGGKPVFPPRGIVPCDPLLRPGFRIERVEVPEHLGRRVNAVCELADVAHVEDGVRRRPLRARLPHHVERLRGRHERGEVRAGADEAVVVVDAVAVAVQARRLVEVRRPCPACAVV